MATRARWVINKRGVRQRYYFGEDPKKSGYTYNRHARGWIKSDLDKIQKEMVDAFEAWGRSKMKGWDNVEQSGKYILRNISDEGDGWYQIGGGTKKTDFKLKLRYNPRQKTLEVYMRGGEKPYKYEPED